MHGALSVDGSDWTPLVDREVIICADLDDAGMKFQNEVKKKCELVCAKNIKFLDLKPVLNELNAQNIKGFDIADAYELGWKPLNLDDLLIEAPFDPNDVLPSIFFIKDNNIYYKYTRKTNDGDEVEHRFLCSYLVVKYRTRDFEGVNWGYLLEIRDADHKIKEIAIPAKMLAGDSLELRQLLLDNGLSLAPRSNKMLDQYIITSKPQKNIRCVTQTGWSNGVYVLPHKIYQYKNKEEIRLQQSSSIFINYKKENNLSSWQEKIGKYAKNNINMMFVISLALAAPLIHLVNMENIAIHLVGPSSIGKTTLLSIASSVWGNSIHNWRTTDNAAETIAELSNDSLLLFDELGQVDGFAADQLSYMLGNGLGKLRSKRSGDAKDIKRFRLALLSSGENGLSSKLQEVGRKVKAGQSVRLLEISANRKYGIFDDLHDFKSGDEFARYLKDVCISNRGTLIDAFLDKLVKNKEEIIKTVQKFRKAWEEEVIANYPESDGQVQRVISKFSLIAACGEICIALKLLPFEELEVSKSCKELLKNWINSRGGTLPQEILEAIKNLQEFIEEHGNSRFEDAWSDEQKLIHNRAGFRKLEEDLDENNIWSYYFLPSAFNKLIGNANKADVCNYLKSKGILEIERSSGKSAKKIRIKNFGITRCYHINHNQLEILK
jgi:putative DNA primase/helicase